MSRRDVVAPRLHVRLSGGVEKKFRGREAWALGKLIDAGKIGLTTLEQPAPRWSHYIYKLRRQGVGIVTHPERHGGEFAGGHGRYKLAAPVEIIERVQS